MSIVEELRNKTSRDNRELLDRAALEIEDLERNLEAAYAKIEILQKERKQSEVIEEYRKKVYSKMEKYTVFGREYIQRIMREVEKEMKGGTE